jgi:hypothetical protein
MEASQRSGRTDARIPRGIDRYGHGPLTRSRESGRADVAAPMIDDQESLRREPVSVAPEAGAPELPPVGRALALSDLAAFEPFADCDVGAFGGLFEDSVAPARVDGFDSPRGARRSALTAGPPDDDARFFGLMWVDGPRAGALTDLRVDRFPCFADGASWSPRLTARPADLPEGLARPR